MSKIDLRTFTDRELLELQKQILEEKTISKEFGKPLFKSDLRFNQDDYNLLLNKIEGHVKKQIPDKVASDVHLPECYGYVDRIREHLIEICDLVFGNFKVSVSNEKKRVRIARGASRLAIDNVDAYEQLYLELLETIEKRCKEEEKHGEA